MKALDSGRRTAPALALLLVLGTGCGDAPHGRPRPPGSAVWVGAAGGLSAGTLRRLRAAGAGELFVEAATVRVAPDGAPRVERAEWGSRGALPPTPATLVLRLETVPPPAAAGRLAAAWRPLRRHAEAAGLRVVGLHALGPGDSPAALAELAELVGALRRALPGHLHLSASLPRSGLDLAAAADLARRVDFVAVPLYGPPEGEPSLGDAEAADHWDPERVARDLERLEALGVDFLLGLGTVGHAVRTDPGGRARALDTRLRLADLLADPALRLRPLDLEALGAGEVAQSFDVRRPTRVGRWSLAPGESVRVVRAAPAHLQAFRRRAAEVPGYLGTLFHRLAAPEEELSLGGAALAGVLADEPADPRPRPRVEVVGRRGRRHELVVGLANPSPHDSDVSLGDWNYLELSVDGGWISEVRPGGFDRHRLSRGAEDLAPTVAGWREPDTVRLYTAYLPPRSALEPARVTIETRRPDARVSLNGRFLLPDGRVEALEELSLPLARSGRREPRGRDAASER